MYLNGLTLTQARLPGLVMPLPSLSSKRSLHLISSSPTGDNFANGVWHTGANAAPVIPVGAVWCEAIAIGDGGGGGGSGGGDGGGAGGGAVAISAFPVSGGALRVTANASGVVSGGIANNNGDDGTPASATYNGALVVKADAGLGGAGIGSSGIAANSAGGLVTKSYGNFFVAAGLTGSGTSAAGGRGKIILSFVDPRYANILAQALLIAGVPAAIGAGGAGAIGFNSGGDGNLGGVAFFFYGT